MTGTLIAVEGPTAVGKTTVATLLAERIRERSPRPVHVSGEPSDTPLGRLLAAAGPASLTGRSLALAIAADRDARVQHEIRPRLAEGQLVVSDRYLASSLALRPDELSINEVWRYNQFIPPPTVTYYLTEQPSVLQARRGRPTHGTDLGPGRAPGRELILYQEAYAFLHRHEWEQSIVDCAGRPPDAVVATILNDLARRCRRA